MLKICQLLFKGVDKASAIAEAMVPLLWHCSTFMKDIESLNSENPEQRAIKLIAAIRKNSAVCSCNIQNVIDFSYLTCLPWDTYGIIDVNLNDIDISIIKNFELPKLTK